MSEEYLRGLRTCFLELNRHKVFSTDRNTTYQEYIEATTSTGKIAALLLTSGWATLFLSHKYIFAVYFHSYRRLRPFLTLSIGVGLSILTHVTLYNQYLISPLNRISLMYETEAREMCPELKSFRFYRELVAEKKAEIVEESK